jgi:hypothetical protein
MRADNGSEAPGKSVWGAAPQAYGVGGRVSIKKPSRAALAASSRRRRVRHPHIACRDGIEGTAIFQLWSNVPDKRGVWGASPGGRSRKAQPQAYGVGPARRAITSSRRRRGRKTTAHSRTIEYPVTAAPNSSTNPSRATARSSAARPAAALPRAATRSSLNSSFTPTPDPHRSALINLRPRHGRGAS